MATENTRIPFGKYRGTKMRDIPNSYLEWLIANLMDSDFHQYAMEAKIILEERKNDPNAIIEESADEFLRRHGYKVERDGRIR